VFEYVARTCKTLGEAIETACHYRTLMYDGAELKLIVESDRAKLRYRLQDRVSNPVTFVEFALTACVVASRHALGFDGAPREVAVHARGAELCGRTRAHLSGAGAVRATHNEVIFGRRALDFPLASADASMHAIFKRYADRLLTMMPTALPLTRRVQALLRDRMDARESAVDDLPDAMHMSERTLRRKLTQEGVVQLRSLVEQTRREQACRYLASSGLSVSEIAHRLGFAHPPAFHRAFRRWLKVSPLQYRRDHAVSPVYQYFETPREK